MEGPEVLVMMEDTMMLNGVGGGVDYEYEGYQLKEL